MAVGVVAVGIGSGVAIAAIPDQNVGRVTKRIRRPGAFFRLSLGWLPVARGAAGTETAVTAGGTGRSRERGMMTSWGE